MMFHYIDYADTAVRTRNRQHVGKQRVGEREDKKQTQRQTITDRKKRQRWAQTQKKLASVRMRGRTCETGRGE